MPTEETIQYILACDVWSVVKKSAQYGKENDPVKIICNHGHILIVENKSGFRFPIEYSEITVIQKQK